MTRQEVYEELKKKYDIVADIGHWQERNSSGLLGVKSYIVPVFSRETGHQAPTIYVENAGQPDEVASFPRGQDPIAKPKEPTLAEKKAQEYNTKRSALVQAKEDVELGIITQAEYDSMLSEIKTLRSQIEGR